MAYYLLRRDRNQVRLKRLRQQAEEAKVPLTVTDQEMVLRGEY